MQPIPPNRLAAITLSWQAEFAFSTFLYIFRPFNYFAESSSVSSSQKLQKRDCPFQAIPFAQTSLATKLLLLACSQPLPQRALCTCLHAVVTFQGVVRFPQKKGLQFVAIPWCYANNYAIGVTLEARSFPFLASVSTSKETF